MISKKSIIISVIALICLSLTSPLYSQVHFSFTLGKDFLKNKVKFGLERGLSISNITGAGSTTSASNLNLGLYLDIQLKDSSWYLHTSALLKSGLGAKDIDGYLLNNSILDSVFNNGTIERQLKYLNFPVLVRYKFSNHIFIEMGPRFGILTRATDYFYQTGKPENGSLYKNNLTDKCNWFDAGIEAGVGYHLMRGKGVNLGLRYYVGMMDIFKDRPSDPVRNQSLTIYLNIPILFGNRNHEKSNSISEPITKKT